MSQESKDLVPVYTESLAQRESLLRAKVEAVKDVIAKGATDSQLAVFVHIAATLDLDPFREEIYWSAQLKKPMIARRGHLKLAKKDPGFEGVYSYVFRSTDTLEFQFTDEGPKWTFKQNMTNRGAIQGAFAVGYHKKWKYPLIRFAYASEFDKGGPAGSAWTAHKETMMRKVPESHVLETMASDFMPTYLQDVGFEGMVEPENIIDVVDSPVEERTSDTSEDRTTNEAVSSEPAPEVKPDIVVEFNQIDGAKWFDLNRVASIRSVFSSRLDKDVEKVCTDLITAVVDRGLTERINSLIRQVSEYNGVEPDNRKQSFTEFCRKLVESSDNKKDVYFDIAEALGFSCGAPELMEMPTWKSAWERSALPLISSYVNFEE